MAKATTKTAPARKVAPAPQKAPQQRSNVQAPAPQKKNVPAKTGLSKYKNVPTGLEQVTTADLIIPRITILQPLSPQLVKSKAEYIKEAQQADFCDTGVGQIFREQLDFVICKFARIYLEWSIDRQGGLVANYGTDASCLEDCERDENQRMVKPNGETYIAETMTFYILNLMANWRRSFIACASTQLKPARQLVTKLQHEEIELPSGEVISPAPCFYRAWTATTVERSNNKGTWHSWQFSPGETIDDIDPTGKLFTAAREFNEMASKGLVQGDLGSMAEETSQEADPNADM